MEKTFYVPSFSRNLISISSLLPLGFSFSFSDSDFSLSNKSKVIGYGTLSDGLFHIQLQNNFTYNSMHVTAGLKRCVMNEESSMLWHRRLGHISIERIKKLVNDGVLSTLDFANFETCVNCIKGKQTNKSKKGAKRSINLLEILHTDICCPDMDENCGTPASAVDPTYSDFWWTPGLGRPPYPLRDLPHFHGSPRTWDLGLKHQILTKWVPTKLVAQLVPTS